MFTNQLREITIAFNFCLLSQCNPIVRTKYGWIRGKCQQAFNKRTYTAFTGIPYADPPVENYRFEVFFK